MASQSRSTTASQGNSLAGMGGGGQTPGNLAAMFGGGGGNLAGNFLGNQGYGSGGSGVNVPTITQQTQQPLPNLPPIRTPPPPTAPTTRQPTGQELAWRINQLTSSMPTYSPDGGNNAMNANSIGAPAVYGDNMRRALAMQKAGGHVPAYYQAMLDKAGSAPSQFQKLFAPVQQLPQQQTPQYQMTNAQRMANAINDRYR